MEAEANDMISVHNVACLFNSLAPEGSEWNSKYGIFNLILLISGWGIFWEISLTSFSLKFTDYTITFGSVNRSVPSGKKPLTV